MYGETLIAQRVIADHMKSHNLQWQQLNMTRRLMELVKGARAAYIADQKKRSQSKIQNEKALQKQDLAQQIQDYPQKISILEGTVIQLEADADKFSFEAGNKNTLTEIKSTLGKSNALKRTAAGKL